MRIGLLQESALEYKSLVKGLFIVTLCKLKGVDCYFQERAVLCAIQGVPISSKQVSCHNLDRLTDFYFLYSQMPRCYSSVDKSYGKKKSD